MRVVYTIGILLLVAMAPINDGKFTPAGRREGQGILEPGDIHIAGFETGGGIVEGNISVDEAPIQVWIIPHADYESKDSFSSERAVYQNFGLLSEFEFDSTFERDLILIMINNSTETQSYDFIILYNNPLIWDGVLFLVAAFMGVFLLVILIAAPIACLRNRRKIDDESSPDELLLADSV